MLILFKNIANFNNSNFKWTLMEKNVDKFRRKPEWLKIKLPRGYKSMQVIGLLNDYGLNTICSSGMCPNKGECWGRGTATFMICGNVCTRNCRFCNVSGGRPAPLDEREIADIVTSIQKLGLRHVVLTSVDRDDLPDYGAGHWVSLINRIKKECPGVTMETLIPDFRGRADLIAKVIEAAPDVISHNLETVRRLTPEVRSVATYDTSLAVIRQISEAGVRSKSGIMLGLGETFEEILETMDDLRYAGCEVLTVGQYLQPSKLHYPVKEYVHPDLFARLEEIGISKGFRHVESGPFVRSSYHAEKHVK